MENVFGQLADIIRPQQCNDIIAVGNFYGKIVIIAVTDLNPRKENVFAGKCISSDCEINSVGEYATNWSKDSFEFYYKK